MEVMLKALLLFLDPGFQLRIWLGQLLERLPEEAGGQLSIGMIRGQRHLDHPEPILAPGGDELELAEHVLRRHDETRDEMFGQKNRIKSVFPTILTKCHQSFFRFQTW